MVILRIQVGLNVGKSVMLRSTFNHSLTILLYPRLFTVYHFGWTASQIGEELFNYKYRLTEESDSTQKAMDQTGTTETQEPNLCFWDNGKRTQFSQRTLRVSHFSKKLLGYYSSVIQLKYGAETIKFSYPDLINCSGILSVTIKLIFSKCLRQFSKYLAIYGNMNMKE